MCSAENQLWEQAHSHIEECSHELGVGSVSAFAVDLLQPITFEPQVLIHPAIRSVGPFLDLKLFAPICTALVPQQVAADRLTAFLQDLTRAITDADQLAATAQGIGRPGLTGAERQNQACQQPPNYHSASRCIGVTTRPSLCASPRLASTKYTRSSSNCALSSR